MLRRIVWAPSHRSRHPASAGRSVRRADRVTRILFVCDDSADARPCLDELAKAHFDVAADVVIDVGDYVGRLRATAYDVVVCCGAVDTDLPLRALDALGEALPGIPFILLAPAAGRAVVERFIATGAFDWVDALDLLPGSVAVALEQRGAREEEDLALKALKSSQALHRALVDNPTYGVCRFDPSGRLLDVNQVLVDMLGYESSDELIQMNIASDLALDSRQGVQLLRAYRRTGQIAVHAMWKRKDGTPLVVRLGGRRVSDGSAASCQLIVDDVTADRAREAQLLRLATTDALTGLANYRQFTRALEAEARRSERTGRPFALLLLDLDALKGINDGYGHETGNRALCRVAAALRRSCRSLDTPARFGGDEFAIVLPETGLKGAGLIGRRICVGLAADAEEPRLSVSVGLAVYPRDGGSMDTLLRIADRALYTMKAAHAPASARSRWRAVLPAAARGALARDGRSIRRSVVQHHAE